jgi:hypothetical protein
MNLKVMAGLMARKVKHPSDNRFTPLSKGLYSIMAIDGDQFEIKKPDGSLCYVSSTELEEKIKNKAVVITNVIKD